MSGGVEVLSNLVLPYNRIAIIAFALLVLGGVCAADRAARASACSCAASRRTARMAVVRRRRHGAHRHAAPSRSARASPASAACALSQIGNVGPDLGQSYIVDSFMVVVLGGVGQLAGTVLAALGLGVAQQAARRRGRRGARQDRRAGLHRHLHPEAAAGPVRAEGPERGGMSAARRRSCLPRSRPRGLLLGMRGWAGVTIALVVVAVLVPLAQPAGARRAASLHVSDYAVRWSARSCATRSCALAMDLIWGYTGILIARPRRCSSRSAATRWACT